MTSSLETTCTQALAAVQSTAAFIRKEREQFSKEAVRFKGRNNLVSYVDTEAEKQLVKALTAILPESGFLTEEKTFSKEGEYVWVIDPLDGTTNYVHGLPACSVSVALMHRNEIILGIVHDIFMEESFYGWKGGGAWMNGKKICVSETPVLRDALLATGFPFSAMDKLEHFLKTFEYMIRHARGIRRLGSAAIDLAYVACGRFDGFFEYNLNAWDVAAGVLLIKEAGGSIHDFQGTDNYIFGKEIVASNGHIHQEMLKAIQQFF